MDLLLMLKQTLLQNNNQSETAKQELKKYLQTNFQEYLTNLSKALNEIYNTSDVRKAAAIQLAAAFNLEDEFERLEQHHKWLSLDQYVRLTIKENVVKTLGSECWKPSGAAKCIAAIACAEFLHNQWSELLPILRQNVTDKQTTNETKVSSLEAIGHICSDIVFDRCCQVMKSNSHEICAAIMFGLLNPDLTCAARNASLHALHWISEHLQTDAERQLVLTGICESTQSPDVHIRVSALKCLVVVVSKYYSYLNPQSQPTLFGIAMRAMTSKVFNEKFAAVELCKKLLSLQADWKVFDAQVDQAAPRVAVPIVHLLPILTESLASVEEFGAEENDKMCKLVVGCLTSLVICRDDSAVFEYIRQFVVKNIENVEWRYRTAAIRAFSSFFTNEMQNLQPMLRVAFPMLIDRLNDSNADVKATAAAAISNLCTLIDEGGGDVINANVERLVKALIKSLYQSPVGVAINVCEVFNRLGLVAKKFETSENPDGNFLTKFYEPIVCRMFQTLIRCDGTNDSRWAAHSALVSLLETTPKSRYSVLLKTAQALHRCVELLKKHLTTAAPTRDNNMLLVVCLTLKHVLNNMKPEDAYPVFDDTTLMLIEIFHYRTGGRIFPSDSDQSGVQLSEEILKNK